jgi:hypothetical protein
VNFIGDNADKYLRKFRKFDADEADRFAWTWHWPAFLFGFWWLLYRKLYVWALIAFILLFVPYWIFFGSLVYGPIANYIYYKHTKKKIIKYKTTKAPDDPREAVLALRKKGGVKVWVPPLAIFAILVIIFSYVHPHFYGYKARHYNAVARTDLTNASFAQHEYFLDNGTYADSVDKLVDPKYGLLLNVEVELTVVRADSNSYEMTSFHRRGKKRYTLVSPHGTVQGRYRKWW